MKTNHLFLLGVSVVLGLPPGGSPGHTAGANKDVSKDVIAVQIRKQGFDCKNPESATRDAEASKPDSDVWVLKCEGVSYKVNLVPKQAAKVEKLPEEKPDTQGDGAPPASTP